jgi:DNA-binding IscR family transcriptional regulator
MQLTTRGRYAVMAMTDLATRDSTVSIADPVCLADIAERQQLSHAYLEQLFAKLRRAELVFSARVVQGAAIDWLAQPRRLSSRTLSPRSMSR